MRAGRKPLAAPVEDKSTPVVLEGEFSAAIDDMREIGAIEQQAMAFGEVSRQIGQIEAFRMISDVSDVAAAQVFENLRKSGAYKGMPYKDAAGNIRRVGDIKELCEAKLGRSYSRFMELSANLRVLGQELYEHTERLGLRAVDYKALRALPEEEQKFIKQAIEETSSRDEVLDVLQQLAVKAAAERESSSRQIAELRDEVTAKEKLLTHKNKQIDELALVKAAPPHQRMMSLREDLTRQMNDVRGAILGKFTAAIEAMDIIYVEEGEPIDLAFLAGTLGQIQADITALRDRFAIPDINPALIPEWVNDPSFTTGD